MLRKKNPSEISPVFLIDPAKKKREMKFLASKTVYQAEHLFINNYPSWEMRQKY